MTTSPLRIDTSSYWPLSCHLLTRMVLCTTLLAAIQGCGGDSQSAPEGPLYYDVLGEYTQSSNFFVARVTTLSTGDWIEMRCGGRMSITSQNANQFSGSFVRRTCLWQDGSLAAADDLPGTVSGTVYTNDSLVLSAVASGPSLSREALEAIGCATESAPTDFEGAISGDLLTASSEATVVCPGLGSVSIQQSIGGVRNLFSG